MNSNHCQLFTILIGFRTASPHTKQRDSYKFPLFISKRGKQMTMIKNHIKLNSAVRAYWILIF